MHTDTCTSWAAAQIFSLTKRLLWPAFSDYAHFSFISSCFFSVRGEVSIKHPASKLYDPYFFSDILVVSYVLSCVPSACRRRQNGFSVPHRGRRLKGQHRCMRARRARLDEHRRIARMPSPGRFRGRATRVKCAAFCARVATSASSADQRARLEACRRLCWMDNGLLDGTFAHRM